MKGMFNKYFPFAGAPGARRRLFCFHYAGGSAAVFRPWVHLHDQVEVIPVELPGRGTRIREKCSEDFAALSAELTLAIAAVQDGRPVHLFGHSMGAVLAFSVASGLANRGIKVENMIVAGRHAPHQPDPSVFRISMGEQALIEELKRLKGTPSEILDNPEILSFVLPMIRSDYYLHESYQYAGEQVTIPIIAHAGQQDAEAGVDQMRSWNQVTLAEFSLEEFPGDHFFVQHAGTNYAYTLLEKLAPAVKARAM